MTLRPSGRHGFSNVRRSLLAGALACLPLLALGGCGQTGQSDYAENWGPAIGAQVPLLAANDQDGNAQTLETLTGPKGLLVVFNRSVDW
ncbi:MAG: hypothetical protein AAGJ50_15565 [Pseudomonadota bacterium]